ncbi:hypothetical protein T05_6869 [Trichinella murrelli]|uniref:Uncharacterized protein n=1 Tax=Trichinella murrelli TaxID=144512 RepID=A0A0V0T6B1_9BILA|nr:hypothetical protein T05_6869 [Trichinella murrelli]
MTVIEARLERRTTHPRKERLATLDACPGNHTNFFCANGVPTSNYGVVVRYLLSDPVRCELYKHLIKRSHPMRQRESQINKQCAEEVAKLGRRAYVSERHLVALLAGGVASREVHRAIRLQDPPTLAEAHKVAKEERRQPHTGVMKQEKDDVTQHLEALERPYEPLGKLDASAAAAFNITDVTPPSYASGNERWREERWQPSPRRPVAWSPSQVSILYVQFYGAFIIQCPRPNLRQQRQQKMNKSDISKNPVHSLLSRKQPITTVNY